MRVKFYLNRPRQKTQTALFAMIRYSGESLKIFIGESIVPDHWNAKTNSARNTPKFPEHPEFNERLNLIRSEINRAFIDYKNKNGHAAPVPAVFKEIVLGILNKNSGRTSFLGYFQDFTNRTLNGQRIDPKSKKPVKEAVGRGYQTTLTHLKQFAEQWKTKLDFDTIDLEFHKDFTDYLAAAPRLLSANSIGGHIQRIKAVLAEATEKGINKTLSFKSKWFVKMAEEADTISLSETELQALRDLDLSQNQRLSNVRDLFLIGCYTGLRFSDFSILKPESIKEGFIRITQTKTGQPVVIPVHEVVKNIIAKNNGLPKSISNVKLNAYLKELCELVPELAKKESKTITKGGVPVTTVLQKWKLITTHTARRSFATNEYLAGTPSITIMAITGHKTEKSFLRYIRVTPDEHAQKIKELWDRRANKLQAV